MYCKKCGAPLGKPFIKDNTKLYVCEECFTEKVVFNMNEPCKHEYDKKSGSKCIHCGE